jgi:hypothetical protein
VDAVRFDYAQSVAAPRHVVEAAYVDAGFYGTIAPSSALAVLGVLDRTADDGVVTLRIRLAFTGEVAPAVRAFVDPARLTWVTVITQCTGAHRSTFEIQPDHYPGLLQCRGDYRYLEQPGGASTRVEAGGELAVKAPIVGRAAERAIAAGFRDHLADEAAALAVWRP